MNPVSPVDTSQFWSDHDHWQDPVTKWEWANEPGGLEYLAALLRESCDDAPKRPGHRVGVTAGLEPILGQDGLAVGGDVTWLVSVRKRPQRYVSDLSAGR